MLIRPMFFDNKKGAVLRLPFCCLIKSLVFGRNVVGFLGVDAIK